MANRRRVHRRRVVDPGLVLHRISNLLLEIECLSPHVDQRDIQRYVLRLEGITTNFRRLSDSAVPHRIRRQIVRGLAELRTLLEERQQQTTLLRRGYTTPRVHTGTCI